MSTNAQNSASLEQANKEYQQGNYAEALILYEHAAYISGGNSDVSEIKLHKAICYKELGEYKNCISELNRVNPLSLNQSLQYHYFYLASLSNYLMGEFGECENRINQLEYYLSDKALPDTLLYLKTLNYCQLKKWEEAKKSGLDYLETGSTSFAEKNEQRARWIKLLNNPPKFKNIQTARWLSTFIPGSGQIYLGKVGEGMLNMIIHAGSLYFGFHEIFGGFYLTGWLGGLGIFQKFYFGGLKRVVFLGHQINEKKQADFMKQIKKTLPRYERGNV